MTLDVSLLCCDCAAQDQSEDISSMNEQGYRVGRFQDKDYTIGSFVPAIPDQEGLGYWGYMSIPKAGIDWWERIPLR